MSSCCQLVAAVECLVIGTNSNGLVGKKDSLLANINLYCPLACLIQETKVSRKNQINIPNYQIFELLRTNGEGGSLLTAVHEKNNPVYVSSGEDNIEILVVQAEFGNKKCHFIKAYGLQEGADRNHVVEFYSKLDQEIEKKR